MTRQYDANSDGSLDVADPVLLLEYLAANQVQLNETVTTLNTTVNALLDSEVELDTTRAERDALQAQVLRLEQDLADTQNTLETVQGERDNFEAQAQELQQDLTDTQAALQAVESERDTLQGHLDQTSQQLATTQGDLGVCEADRSQLTSDLAARVRGTLGSLGATSQPG